MQLTSGPARGDALYFGSFFLLCLAFAGWYFYDGSKGYILKNREEARKQLTSQLGKDQIPTDMGRRLSEKEFKALQAANPTRIEDVRTVAGEPLIRRETSTGESIETYVSDYGQLTVPVRGGVVSVAGMKWSKWYKDREEVEAQYYFALLPLVMGLFFGWKLVKALNLRARIDETGMTYGSKRIEFPAMKRLVDYSKKGWVDLYYDDDGQEQRLRIDNQKIGKFDEIIDVLCKTKGFADPRTIEVATD